MADLAAGRRAPDRDRLLSLSVDRLAAFFGIMAGLPADDPLQRRDLVIRLRVLGNLAELRRVERRLPAGARAATAVLRAATATAYRPADDRPDRPALLARVEAAYDALLAAPADALRARGLAALTGLRLAWTPDPAFEALVGTRPA